MSEPWIPDEKGIKMIIPKELYPEIRKMIRNQRNILFHSSISQKDIDIFFKNISSQLK